MFSSDSSILSLSHIEVNIMSADATAGLEWIFSAVITLGNLYFTNSLLSMMAAVAVLALVYKLYRLLK